MDADRRDFRKACKAYLSSTKKQADGLYKWDGKIRWVGDHYEADADYVIGSRMLGRYLIKLYDAGSDIKVQRVEVESFSDVKRVE